MNSDKKHAEKPIRLLLVEDEDDFRNSCVRWMRRKGHEVAEVNSAADALHLLQRETFDVGLFDMNMPGMSGLELLQRVHQDSIDLEVIMLTGQGTIETAVAAMKMGASDFLSKPCSLGDIEHHIQMARQRRELRKENAQLKAVIFRSKPKLQMVGLSNVMQAVSRTIAKVAPTDKPVLIQGESGTGKEVVARAIQELSLVAERPFVTINCAALPENLVESELFGHQKGSFTGATTEKPGLFEIADGGTLFIDEIGELPLALQPKLLRVLEDGSLRRIGCHRQRNVKVRIIAATNRDLKNDVQAGRFREDLYYRINVLGIDLPPLREREGDIDRLLDHYLPKPWHVDAAVRKVLNSYPWPGNVRQLINTISRATVLADHHEITLDDLPSEILNFEFASEACVDNTRVIVADKTASTEEQEGIESQYLPTSAPVLGNADYRLDEIARAHVLAVLASEKGNKASAARKLGIHRRKLYRLLERFEKNSAADIESLC